MCLAAAVAVPAVASAGKTCNLNPISGVLDCVIVVDPSPPLVVRLSEELPIVWSRTPFQPADPLSNGWGCIRTTNGVTEIGAGYVIVLENTATGEQLFLDYVCEWPGEDPPVPPPPPPTPGQLAEDNDETLTLTAALSPASSIGGLTGLDSWLWCNDPGEVAAQAALNGWVADGSVRVVEVGWEIDGPSGLVSNTLSCGSESAPALTWTPETMGDHSIVVTTVWAGTWDLTWNGIPMGTYPLGPLALTADLVVYPVDEYRGELTG
jgi:hypothetical protein